MNEPYPLGKFVGLDGEGTSGVLIICEAPGEEEDAAGIPLVGPTGKLTNRMISRTKDPDTGALLSREQFWLGNVVQYRPPDNKLEGQVWERPAILYCRPQVEEWLKKLKPRAILTCGNIATRWFIPEAHSIKEWRGYAVETPWGPVIPTYHPAFLLRGNFALCQAWQHDLAKAVRVARTGITRRPTSYVLHPSLVDGEAFLYAYLSAGQPPLAFDIETPYSGETDESDLTEASEWVIREDDASYKILRISFAFREAEGITMPWEYPFIDIARELLATPGDKLVWNEPFDVPRLRANDAPVRGRIFDTMWAWHLLEPHLPYSLKYAATFLTDLPQWKSQSFENPEWYSCVDSDALLRCHTEIARRLEAAGKWPLYLRHVVEVSQVLRRMSEYGVGTSSALRAEAKKDFDARFTAAVAAVQRIVPQACRKRKRYKTREATLRKRGLLERGEWIVEDDGRPEPPPKEKKPRKKRVKKEDQLSFPAALIKEFTWPR